MTAETLGKMTGDGSEAPPPDEVPSREEDGITHACRGDER
jgi:hypothetical protein